MKNQHSFAALRNPWKLHWNERISDVDTSNIWANLSLHPCSMLRICDSSIMWFMISAMWSRRMCAILSMCKWVGHNWRRWFIGYSVRRGRWTKRSSSVCWSVQHLLYPKIRKKIIPPGTKVNSGCGIRNPDGVGFRITGDNDNESAFGGRISSNSVGKVLRRSYQLLIYLSQNFHGWQLCWTSNTQTITKLWTSMRAAVHWSNRPSFSLLPIVWPVRIRKTLRYELVTGTLRCVRPQFFLFNRTLIAISYRSADKRWDISASREHCTWNCGSSRIPCGQLIQRYCIAVPRHTGWNCRECQYGVPAADKHSFRWQPMLCVRLGQRSFRSRRQIPSDFETWRIAGRVTWFLSAKIAHHTSGQTFRFAR